MPDDNFGTFITAFFYHLKQSFPRSWLIEHNDMNSEYFYFLFGPSPKRDLLATVKTNPNSACLYLHFAKANEKQKTLIKTVVEKNKKKLPIENF